MEGIKRTAVSAAQLVSPCKFCGVPLYRAKLEHRFLLIRQP